MRHPLTFAGPLVGLALLFAACGASSGTTAPSTVPVPAASTASAGTASAAPASTGIAAAAAPASPTATCTAPATATTSQTEGPYYKAGAPASADLATEGMSGTRITLTGQVLGTDCTPLANAKVETWQADANGTYDNTGYTLRGYVMTDAQGRYTIHTIVPGE